MKRNSIKGVYSVICVMLLLGQLTSVVSASSDEPAWIDEFASIAIQDSGRTMPLDTYARHLAIDLTGRGHWSADRGPEVFADRSHMLLLCDLLFNAPEMLHKPLIGIENRPLKEKLGLDPQERFFAPMELASNSKLMQMFGEIQRKSQEDPDFRESKEDRLVIAIQNALGTVSQFNNGMTLRICPNPASATFLDVGEGSTATAPKEVRDAFIAFGNAYRSGSNVDQAVVNLHAALNAAGTIDAAVTKRVNLEILYNHHRPWLWTAVLYGLAIVTFGLSYITLHKPLSILGSLFMIAGVAEQCFGIYLRVMILERPPVTNTFESILWMGIVAIIIASIAQVMNRRGWYIMGGLIAAELCVLFSMLVPLEDQTNAIPPVLRSNYWLIVHVLTIVASYGVLALCAVLGHVYLFRSILFAKKSDEHMPMGSPIIAQVYRTMQVGVFLLTAGTILGGVWAADSWGRFWGWDPKETWALISIVIYVALLHGRFVGWLKDFGLAMASVIGFISIVWTFYGVNYVMASGLHSYGFGSGGEFWVGLWALAEIALLVIAKIRHHQLLKATRERKHAARVSANSPASDHEVPMSTPGGLTPQAS